MVINEIELFPLTEKHIEVLRLWRNSNRFSFINQAYITYDMQKAWFERYKKNRKDTVYIVYYTKAPVGVLGITKGRGKVEIGRLMLGEKAYARKGVMGAALETVIIRNRNKKILLKVIQTNLIALSFYKKHKFKIVAQEKNWYIMERYL